MTGYGRGEASARGVTVVVELRSVNNRFRDVQLRCPREYMALEPRINNLLKDPFSRGRIDAFVRRQAGPGAAVVRAHVDVARAYVEAWDALKEALPDLGDEELPSSFLLAQPGVFEVTEAEVDVMREWDVVETAMTSAVADLVGMREAEGRALYQDLHSHLAEMRSTLAEVEEASDGINDRLRQKLEARVKRLLGERIDAVRLAQEAALLADKADVSEEIARLRSHVEQFAEALEAAEPVGRRLDFLLQEMNREVNTIGSKAAESPVGHRVVQMKSVLERMREQAANVE